MRARNAIIVALTYEVHCPHCGAAQPAPGGSEFLEVHEAKAMCNGATRACVACDEPVRFLWRNARHGDEL